MSGEFDYGEGTVEQGEEKHFRYQITETYLGDSVEIPVSIINGEQDGKTVFLTAAVHGDELNGIEVVKSVARDWDSSNVQGTLVCIPVLNVPGFLNQERYLPIQDRDLNRYFPGNPDGTSASRIANKVWEDFLSKCDLGLDFHTSTRGRTNMFHVRADLENPEVKRLARSFASNIILNDDGSEGTIRGEATDAGIPTITTEMGQAHRFERDQIQKALDGIRSVFAEYDIHSQETVSWPGWTESIDGWGEKTWIRADAGGLIEFKCEVGDLVEKNEDICIITNPFETKETHVKAPFTGLAVGLLQNPVVYPGNPICHFVEPGEDTIEVIQMIRD